MNDQQSVSLKALVYRGIMDQICEGNIAQDAVITEKQMIDMFGVSKSPVREALIQLCAENVLKNIPRFGYMVVPVTFKDIHDLTEMRIYLELGSLPSVLENITPVDIQELRRLNDLRHQDIESKTVGSAWNNNCEFHLRIAKSTQNAKLVEAVGQTLDVYRRAYAQAYMTAEKKLELMHAETMHDAIVEALERRDLQAAHEALREDIERLEACCLT